MYIVTEKYMSVHVAEYTMHFYFQTYNFSNLNNNLIYLEHDCSIFVVTAFIGKDTVTFIQRKLIL